jgi:hypothetical protein
MVEILAVVAPQGSSSGIGQNQSLFLFMGVLALMILIATLLRPRPRCLAGARAFGFDPQKGEYVLIPGGVYRVLRPTSDADGAVTLCADERVGGEFGVANSVILGIVPPPAPEVDPAVNS